MTEAYHEGGDGGDAVVPLPHDEGVAQHVVQAQGDSHRFTELECMRMRLLSGEKPTLSNPNLRCIVFIPFPVSFRRSYFIGFLILSNQQQHCMHLVILSAS